MLSSFPQGAHSLEGHIITLYCESHSPLMVGKQFQITPDRGSGVNLKG